MAVDLPKRVVHGGTGKRQQEKTHKTVLDFSASINPFPPQFKWECTPECLTYYPDNNYTRLKEQIALTFGCNPDECCVGNGSIELIRVFCSAVLSSGKQYSVETPTFGEYELSAQLSGATRAQSPTDAAVSFICNPNNPTGHLRTKTEMQKILEGSACDQFLFVDEAFIELAAPDESLVDVKDDRLFVLRSLTKSFAVPGLRFGYGFGNPALIEKIETARPPWSVNAYAEAFALQAFRHMDALDRSRELIGAERTWLSRRLSAMGFLCYPSSVNYLLAGCGHAATPLVHKLEQLGILVRDCTSFGLPSSIRIAVRTREENTQLIEALSSCVQ